MNAVRKTMLAAAVAMAAALLPAAASAQVGTEQAGEPPAGSPAPNGVTAFGSAGHHGPDGGMDLAQPLVGIAGTPSGGGYWTVASDGGVFSFGDAAFEGSAGHIDLVEPIVGIAAAPTGSGYWLVASDGGVFSFGDAGFQGSAGGIGLAEPIVAMAATPTGEGYWLAASDGGVFAFGDAEFHGSAGDVDLVQPIVDIAATVEGDGYWLLAADGGVFSFGGATFAGSAASEDFEGDAAAIAAQADGDGYWIATRSGDEVFAYGVTEHGTPSELDFEDPAPVVDIAAHPGDGYWIAHAVRGPLEIDDRGPAIEALQQRLHELGYWVGSIDGVYGDLTQQAVYAFQKYEGLTVDGVAGPETRRRLQAAERPRPARAAGDLVEIDKARQLLFVVRDGRAAWVFNTSTGDEEPYRHEGQRYEAETPTGEFRVLREIDGWRTSHLGRLYRPKYFTTTGIAVHGYTFVPPYPASQGCVRVSNTAMDFLWAQGHLPIGSTVVVHGTIPGS